MTGASRALGAALAALLIAGAAAAQETGTEAPTPEPGATAEQPGTEAPTPQGEPAAEEAGAEAPAPQGEPAAEQAGTEAPGQQGEPAAEQAGTEAPGQRPEGQIVATHGEWQVRCTEGRQVCVMSQTGKDPSGKEVVEVQLRKLEGAKTADGTPIPAAVQILTPLGVLLPAGVRIQVDAQKERAAPFEICTPTGCVVRQPLSTNFLNEMKAGANAKLTLVAAPQQEIPVTISLSGFTKAFESL